MIQLNDHSKNELFHDIGTFYDLFLDRKLPVSNFLLSISTFIPVKEVSLAVSTTDSKNY